MSCLFGGRRTIIGNLQGTAAAAVAARRSRHPRKFFRAREPEDYFPLAVEREEIFEHGVTLGK